MKKIKFGYESLPKKVNKVYINGLLQIPGENYTIKCNNILLKDAEKGDRITIELTKEIRI